MEDRKKSQVLLAVIGVATLLVAVIGATFAYFSAANVSGNSSTNTITAQTAQYGNTTVTYDGTNGTINTGTLDLKESEKGTDYKYLMKFTVATTATAAQNITVNWKSVTNTFCKYRNASYICTDTPTDTAVTGEIVYDFYSCSSAGYTGTTSSGTSVTINAGCTKISAATPADVPATGATGILHTAASLSLAAGGTNYYALVVTFKNLDANQNYQQQKSFTGQVNVGIAIH